MSRTTRIRMNGNLLIALSCLFVGREITDDISFDGERLLRAGLIRPNMRKDLRDANLTDRGITFVQMMLDTPLPVQSWRDPRS